jgi:hypothetical protein
MSLYIKKIYTLVNANIFSLLVGEGVDFLWEYCGTHVALPKQSTYATDDGCYMYLFLQI